MARNTVPRKQTMTYYFSVEGKTEKWYLEWLEAQINANKNASCLVKFNTRVEKDPVSFVKNLVVQKKTTVWHLSDIEGPGEEQLLTVQNTLSRMKAAKNLGKSVTYKWGYSNLSFDLWMILHKMNCNAEMNGVDGYLSYLNKAFGTQFDSMKKYKEEANFRYCLGKLTFQEVLTALSRARTITQRNERDGYPVTRFKGYCYYIHNPSLDLHQPIEAILKDCNLL